MLRGVKFGKYHTAADWELILNSKSLTPPKPKQVYISVDGRDGDLDLSEALTGEIKYENRTASFTFLLTEGTYSERERLITKILSVIHGKKLTIILDDEPDYYLSGRCTATDVTNTRAYGTIEVECNCDPWKYALNETNRTIEVDNSSVDVVCTNMGVKSVIPELTVTGNVTIEVNDSIVALSDGTYKLTSLILKSGATVITIEGSGTVTLTYREGIL